MIEGIAAGIGLEYRDVIPAKWKKQMGLINKDKDMSRMKALQLWPDRAEWLRYKKHHNRAEAALIAQYWIEVSK